MWNFGVKGKDGVPSSCPHIGLVLDYDFAVREKSTKLMNIGNEFQKSLETSMADSDLKLQKFTAIFSCEVNSSDCRALSAPGGFPTSTPSCSGGSKRPNFTTHESHTNRVVERTSASRLQAHEALYRATNGSTLSSGVAQWPPFWYPPPGRG